MANWLYNGVELPELPEWDKETYPYAYIGDATKALLNKRYVLYLTNKPLFYSTDEGCQHPEATPETKTMTYKCFLSDLTQWVDGTTYTWAVWYPGSSAGSHGGYAPIWSNYDMPNGIYSSADGDFVIDSTVYFTASAPINLESKLTVSVKVAAEGMVLYGNFEVPSLPEWDRETYPYASIYNIGNPANGLFYLRCSAKKTVYESGSFVFPAPALNYDYKNGAWEFSGESTKDYSQSPIFIGLGWANHDVIDTVDGTVYRSASELAQVAASFTCSNLNTTDSVYKIAAWCYPKGTSYQDAPNTYVSAAAFPGKEHFESWRFTGLTADTEYELYACILADDVATDHNALATFTLDGVAELDFTNATLNVEGGNVEYTDYVFTLAYAGLPYMADGTSAVFDIVGVTDAGDKAYMGWKISSGSGTVNGTFVDLEPLTDYTATFEVYYNGQPTGITATVDFTTAEDYTPSGYDRDSFLLGFASGLGCTAATKTDAEYNSWMWGYIVGSALRKAL